MFEDKIKLYRGDFEKIKEFQVKETCKYGLLGQGIYLSNREKVATSYRTKGQTGRFAPKTIWMGHATTRLTALEEGFKSFLEDALHTENIHSATSKVKEKFSVEKRKQFNNLVEEGVIKANYLRHGDKGNLHYMNVRFEKQSVQKVGYLSEFEFDKESFEISVLKLDGVINDKFFWELMWENSVDVGVHDNYRENYIKDNSQRHFSLGPSCKNLFPNGKIKTIPKLRKVMEPYGIKGLEYNGGILTGGYGVHRAFCMWDEDFVNESKVRRYR